MKALFGLLAVAGLACVANCALATPALYLDFSKSPEPLQFQTRDWHDTVGVRVYADLGSLPSKVEGFEFYVSFPCSVRTPCAVARAADVAAFQPDSSLIGVAEVRLCDEVCACNACEAPSHWRLHIRTDRLSTVPADFRGPIGTLHLKGTRPMSPVDLQLVIARFWVFGSTPLEIRAVEVTAGNTARFGGIAPSGRTQWGVLRRVYQ